MPMRMCLLSTTTDFFDHINKGYTTKGDYITVGAAMLEGETLTDAYVKVPLKTLNRF